MISVLTSPIFTVRKQDGTKAQAGLRELLENAQSYADLEARTPTGRCALLRLIIALLEDVYRPEDLDERKALFTEGRFDMERLDEYIADCEKDGPRFLLDDSKHPFMQMPFDPKLDEKAEKPIATLTFDVPAGNNHIHLDHRYENELVLSPAEAFEALVEKYLFCPAGLSGPSNINNTPPVYFLLRGNSLFETLVLNMVSVGEGEELGNIPADLGNVPWRTEQIVMPREPAAEMTFLRALTWMPRRATLLFEEDGLVRRCLLQPGLDFRGDGRWRDPHVAYFQKKDGTWGTLKPEEGRQIWRDVGKLLEGRKGNFSRPITVDNQTAVCEEEVVRVDAVGLLTKNEACLGWMSETLRLPEALLSDEGMAGRFCECVDVSEKIVREMAITVEKKLSVGSDGRKTADHQVSDQACALFLQLMHDELFGGTMDGILNDRADWRSAFADAVRKANGTVLKTVVNQSGLSVEMMKRQEDVRGLLTWKVNKELEGW